ncbi:glycosyltransferase family 2 protein [Apibacter muscae]|uniref:glycosyltransferase family 2 protein n=1 Tax=Apibacter muscae TaxID=2509004 RepID=UPI0011AE0446|nr:glycosyltransferase family 2 protein [Apibacter muscae]TWP23747.1 glycosyltransferase family 2 protein [Apibacter muscae]
MTLSIIIVNYNGINYLEGCLNSIFNNLQLIDYEVIIIDNKSTDDSVEFIKKKFPNVILIESDDNLGFAKGNNIASKNAKGKYLLLLNNDTILNSNLNNEIDILNKNNWIGALGIQMLNKNYEYTCSTGRFPRFNNIYKLKNLYLNQKENLNKNEIFKVDWIEGSFILIPHHVWAKIQGFTEDYFMYAEDIDICKKIKNLNYEIVFYPKSTYIHFGGFNSERNKLLISSLKTYCDKNMPIFERFISKKLLNLNLIIKKMKNIRHINIILLSFFFYKLLS